MKIFIQIVLWIAHILLYVFRDFTFVNINSQIGHLQAVEGSRFELFNYTHSFIENFLSEMNVSDLTNLKWGLTILFSITFCLLTIFLLKSLLNNWKNALKLSILFYGVLLILGAILYFTLGYTVSREIMIIPQSPIASIMLFMAVKIFKKED